MHILTDTPMGYTCQGVIHLEKKNCTSCGEEKVPHPDHGLELNRLNRIQGQVEGIVRMIVDRRYCPDILIQLRAVQSALKSVEGAILKKHIQDCVKNAMSSKSEKDINQKVEELIALFLRN